MVERHADQANAVLLGGKPQVVAAEAKNGDALASPAKLATRQLGPGGILYLPWGTLPVGAPPACPPARGATVTSAVPAVACRKRLLVSMGPSLASTLRGKNIIVPPRALDHCPRLALGAIGVASLTLACAGTASALAAGLNRGPQRGEFPSACAAVDSPHLSQ